MSEGRCQRHSKKPAHTLVATEDASLQLVRRRFHLVRELEDLFARSRQAVARRQLFEHLRPEAFLELCDASQHGRVIHTEALGGCPHRASARDGKKVANVIPVDHGAIRHRAVRLPKPVSNAIVQQYGRHHSLCRRARGPIPNGRHRSLRLASVIQPDRFCTTDVRVSALNAWLQRTHLQVLGGLPERPKLESERKNHGKA